jgi:hypothetical protein
VPHSLSDAQKRDRIAVEIDLLRALHRQAGYSFFRIVTDDESWFACLYPFDQMFEAGPDKVISKENAIIGGERVILKILFGGVSRVTLNALRSRARSNQDYFIHNILPDTVKARGSIADRFRLSESFGPMDN